MKVLNDADAGCDIEIHLNHTIDSWTIRITDATRDGARAFATPGRHQADPGRTAMKLGLWLTLWAWPALTMAWEEEPAIGGGGHFGAGVPVPGRGEGQLSMSGRGVVKASIK